MVKKKALPQNTASCIWRGNITWWFMWYEKNTTVCILSKWETRIKAKQTLTNQCHPIHLIKITTKKYREHQVLLGMWRNWNPYIPLGGMKCACSYIGKQTISYVQTETYMWLFMEALFLIAPHRKQLKCPSADKRTKLYPYNGILFINQKAWNTDTCCNMDASQKHYAKWMKLSTEDIQ